MTTPPREVTDYLATLTDDDLAAVMKASRVPATQLERSDLKTMTPEQIVTAKAEGRLNDMLGVPRERTELIAKARRLEPVTAADLKGLLKLGHHDLVAAYSAHPDRITD